MEMSKDLDAQPPIRSLGRRSSQRKSRKSAVFRRIRSNVAGGTKVEPRLQEAQVRLVSRPFNPNNPTPLYKEPAMIKEFEKKQPASTVTEFGTDPEAIRTRAFELYVERGMEDGHDVEDWLRAEEAVLAGDKSSVAA